MLTLVILGSLRLHSLRHSMTSEQKVLSIMSQYYGSKKKALEWYNTPNANLSYYQHDKPTPKHYVESGKAKELLEWIELCIS